MDSLEPPGHRASELKQLIACGLPGCVTVPLWSHFVFVVRSWFVRDERRDALAQPIRRASGRSSPLASLLLTRASSCNTAFALPTMAFPFHPTTGMLSLPSLNASNYGDDHDVAFDNGPSPHATLLHLQGLLPVTYHNAQGQLVTNTHLLNAIDVELVNLIQSHSQQAPSAHATASDAASDASTAFTTPDANQYQPWTPQTPPPFYQGPQNSPNSTGGSPNTDAYAHNLVLAALIGTPPLQQGMQAWPGVNYGALDDAINAANGQQGWMGEGWGDGMVEGTLEGAGQEQLDEGEDEGMDGGVDAAADGQGVVATAGQSDGAAVGQGNGAMDGQGDVADSSAAPATPYILYALVTRIAIENKVRTGVPEPNVTFTVEMTKSSGDIEVVKIKDRDLWLWSHVDKVWEALTMRRKGRRNQANRAFIDERCAVLGEDLLKQVLL